MRDLLRCVSTQSIPTQQTGVGKIWCEDGTAGMISVLSIICGPALTMMELFLDSMPQQAQFWFNLCGVGPWATSGKPYQGHQRPFILYSIWAEW